MKFSIIIPIYNAETTIKRCLDSVLAQTFRDFECILVNDGSCDNTQEILNYYTNIDNRFIIINKKNGGVSSARNVGIKKAQGEYIVFIDADDFINNDYLLGFASCNSDFVLSGVKVITEKTNQFSIHKPQKKIFNKNEIYEVIENREDKTIYRSPWSKAFKRSIIINNDLKFDKGIHYGEDYIFNLLFLSLIESAETIDNYDYNYMAPEADKIYHFDANEYLRTIKKYIKAISYSQINKEVMERDIIINKVWFYSVYYKFCNTLNRKERFVNLCLFIFRGLWLYNHNKSLIGKFKSIIEIWKLTFL